MNNYHFTKNQEGEWSLKREGAQRATRNFEGMNKADAIRSAAGQLRRTPDPASLKIHKEDGRIQEERTYPRSADPTKYPS